MWVRDAMSGFVFFNVEGNLYDYDASSQSFGLHDGRLLISKEFATALGRRADAGVVVGKNNASYLSSLLAARRTSHFPLLVRP